MKKSLISIVLLMCVFIAFTSINAKATFIVATFADPSNNSSNPLFNVNFNSMTLTGGWSDTKIGLLLNIPYSGHNFTDAWFTISQLSLTQIIPSTLYSTGSGVINFYANGNSITPLLVINFVSGDLVSNINLGANNLFVANNVTITGSEITGALSEEEFSFSFANPAHLDGSTNWDDGFAATAAFTSSAIPEPATIALLSFGVLSLIRRKK